MTDAELISDVPPLAVSIGSIRIMSASTELDPSAEGELEVSWGTRADQITGSTVYVLGVLNAKGDKVSTSVYVALVCTVTDNETSEFSEAEMKALATSRSVVHVLYDTAAQVARQLLAIVQSEGTVPHLTPPASWLETNRT